MARLSYSRGVYRAGEQAVVQMPFLTLTAANAKRGWVDIHGYTQDATAAYGVPADAGSTPTGAELMGNTVMIPDAGANGGKASFGNDDSITAVGAAVTWLQAQPGVKTDKVIIGGGSMGALPALNWARQNLAKVAAISLIVPGLDLQYAHDTAPTQSQNGVTVSSVYPNLKADIEASWGGGTTPPAGYYATHSPIVYASQLAGIPITMWVSNNDAITNSPAVPDAFVTAVGPSCAIVNCGSQPGIGHAAPCATIEAQAAFLQGYV